MNYYANNEIYQIPKNFLTSAEVCRILKISRPTLKRYIEQNNFPKPIKLSSKNFRWNYEEIIEYLEIKKVPLYASIYYSE